jgi:hypothetical protein
MLLVKLIFNIYLLSHAPKHTDIGNPRESSDDR